MALKILHFSLGDASNGANKAALRVHQALRDHGHRSRLLVAEKDGRDADVIAVPPAGQWRQRWGKLRRELPLLRGTQPSTYHFFNLDRSCRVDRHELMELAGQPADMLCLHVVTYLLSIRDIAMIYQRCGRPPIVQVLMDMEPLTGGCHHSLECQSYRTGCGNCPQLKPSGPRDASRRIWLRRQHHLWPLPITFVAPTRWIEARVRESALWADRRVEYIPLALDSNLFRPIDRHVARDLLRIPPKAKVLFFGSHSLSDERKGMNYLAEALAKLAGRIEAGDAGGLDKENIHLLVAGQRPDALLGGLPFASHYAGYIREDLVLALAYQAADVFICPSIHDAGPMMIPEAMLCGTPVVAFDTGGAPDLIQTMRNGYLARFKDASDLCEGMVRVLSGDGQALSLAARQAAQELHEAGKVARRYQRLFGELVADRQKGDASRS